MLHPVWTWQVVWPRQARGTTLSATLLYVLHGPHLLLHSYKVAYLPHSGLKPAAMRRLRLSGYVCTAETPINAVNSAGRMM